MEGSDSHYVPEQNTAYRRGLVLGLTMAEVGILIISYCFLRIAFDLWRSEGRFTASSVRGGG